MLIYKLTKLAFAIVASAASICAYASDAGADTYQKPDAWLCRPDHLGLCATPSDVTVVAADGSLSLSARKPIVDPAIDCFYVYPTVSLDPAGNSSMVAGEGEKRVIASQFAPFASVCRPYAPIYRQVTIAGLHSVLTGGDLPVNADIGYQDVLAAWQHYLHDDNHGRGVVLIGHSQGSRVLARLLQEEIEGKPDQAKLLAAILPGFNVEVPKGEDVGGTFKHIPLCRNSAQTGCVVSYESFRAETPPPANAHFARTKQPGMEIACTDPAKLSNLPLDMNLPITVKLSGEPDQIAAYSTLLERIHTPFFALPGRVQAHCANDSHGAYLAVSVLPLQPGDKRPSDIPGDLIVRGYTLYDWGLHLIDMNLAMGNLIAFVGQKNKAQAAP